MPNAGEQFGEKSVGPGRNFFKEQHMLYAANPYSSIAAKPAINLFASWST